MAVGERMSTKMMPTEFEITVRGRGTPENRLRIVEIRYPVTVRRDRAIARLLSDLVGGADTDDCRDGEPAGREVRNE